MGIGFVLTATEDPCAVFGNPKDNFYFAAAAPICETRASVFVDKPAEGFHAATARYSQGRAPTGGAGAFTGIAASWDANLLRTISGLQPNGAQNKSKSCDSNHVSAPAASLPFSKTSWTA
jgi:hypothetical protein